jgi:2-polyprenyl-3-methyl-5-hydroxy-6-metoxy-1,4-benzoquinol methylase
MKSKGAKIKWTHQIELPSGVTPGHWKPCYEHYGLAKINFKNKRVLDIGCLDGLYSFYSEKQGAKEVVAIDINDINQGQFRKEFNPTKGKATGFMHAHQALKSKVKYLFPYSVYDLDKKVTGKFDIVLCLGLIYHLAHPVLALEKINQITHKGGIVVIETEVSNTFTRFYHRFQFKHGKVAPNHKMQKKLKERSLKYFLSHSAKGRLLKTFLSSKVQAILWKIVNPFFDKGGNIYKNDISNFFVMDHKTIERMIDFTGFKIKKKIPNPLSSRMTYLCLKMKEIDPIYAYDSFTKKKFETNL